MTIKEIKEILILTKNIIYEQLNELKEVLIVIGTIIFTFLTPIWGILLTTAIFVGFDTLFSIYTTIKLGGIKDYKSSKLFNIVPKTFFYLSTLVLMFLLDYFVAAGSIFGIDNFLTKVMCVFWIYIEVKSIDETSIKLGNESFCVLFKRATRKLYSIKKDLTQLLNDKKEDE